MKAYLRIFVFFIVAAAILIVLYLVRQTAEPQSAVIARERDRYYASQDQERMKKDPIYAIEVREKLAFLDYRQALACNAEHKPDQAIEILQRLINEEEAGEKSGIPRRSRSFMREADYYEALKESFELKNNAAEVNKALDHYAQLRTKASELRRLESREDGKHVGQPAD